jgi:hypothetical protein
MLITEAGFDPLGLVVGSSIYHIGIQVPNWLQEPGDDGALGGDVPRARAGDDTDGGGGRRARRRRRSSACGWTSAATTGAARWPSSSRSAPRSATARGRCTAPRTAARSPATCRAGVLDAAADRPPPGRDGDGQLRLPRRPPRAAEGGRAGRTQRRAPNYTQALYSARELAMQRMQTEAQALEAKGIVGVDLQEKSHGWGNHI